GADARCDRADKLPRTWRRHRSFGCEDLLQRSALNKLHHQEWHGATYDAEVSDGNDVRVTNRRGGECFLPETRRQHRIVADEIRQNDFYCVRSFEKDVSRLKNDAHTTLPETALEQVAGVEC